MIQVIKKLRKILTRKEEHTVVFLCVLMTFGALIEMLSVSLIVPFTEAVLSPDTVFNHRYAQVISKYTGITDGISFVVFYSIFLAACYIFKNFFLLFQYDCLYKFSNESMAKVQCKMMKYSLYRPYEYYMGVSSGELVQAITGDVLQAFTLLTSVLSFFSEMAVILALMVALLVYSPIITILVITIMSILLGIMIAVIRPILKKKGELNHTASTNMYKWELQSFQGIKEIKITNNEAFFSTQFDKSCHEHSDSSRKYQTLSLLPKYMIEAFGMGVLFVVISVVVYKSGSVEVIAPTIAMLAMIAIRVLPAVNRISSTMSAISFYEPMLDKTVNFLKEINEIEEECSNIKQTNITLDSEIQGDVELKDVSFTYLNSTKKILDDSNLVIHRGQSVGFVGASGAGKTTVLDILLGLLAPQKGDVLVDEISISNNLNLWRSNLGYVPQSIFLLDDSVKANVAFGVDENDIDEDRVWNALKDAALYDLVMDLPDKLESQLGERGMRLSGGQRQRIGIARALYNDPDYLFLDEATSALDQKTENEIMESINKLHGRKTIIVVAHRLSTLKNCDVIYEVKDGQITNRDKRELLTND